LDYKGISVLCRLYFGLGVGFFGDFIKLLGVMGDAVGPGRTAVLCGSFDLLHYLLIQTKQHTALHPWTLRSLFAFLGNPFVHFLLPFGFSFLDAVHRTFPFNYGSTRKMGIFQRTGGLTDVKIGIIGMLSLHHFDFVFIYLVILLYYAISLLKKVLLFSIKRTIVKNQLCFS
jgi:hypothetical protein